MSDVTQIIARIESGDGQASEELLPLVYAELRRLAEIKLAGEKPGQTLQATALVHEAYVRLIDQTNPQQWDNSRHFFSAAAEAMRRILIERARQRASLKRGGDRERVELAEIEPAVLPLACDDILGLDEALAKTPAAASPQSRAGQAPVLRRPDHRPGCPDSWDFDHQLPRTTGPTPAPGCGWRCPARQNPEF